MEIGSRTRCTVVGFPPLYLAIANQNFWIDHEKQPKGPVIYLEIVNDNIKIYSKKKQKKYKKCFFHAAPPFFLLFAPREPAKLTASNSARMTNTISAQRAYILYLTSCAVWL